eukprot:scaffold307_cov390-Prasinococcus_capsulatus_cf.AAC.20
MFGLVSVVRRQRDGMGRGTARGGVERAAAPDGWSHGPLCGSRTAAASLLGPPGPGGRAALVRRRAGQPEPAVLTHWQEYASFLRFAVQEEEAGGPGWRRREKALRRGSCRDPVEVATMGKGGGKNQHSKDRMYITRTEWQRDYGGYKVGPSPPRLARWTAESLAPERIVLRSPRPRVLSSVLTLPGEKAGRAL